MSPGALGLDFQSEFFARNPNAFTALELFEYLPSAYLYSKDRESRFVKVNRNFLSIYDLPSQEYMLGKTDRDFHPPALAEAYIAEDKRVMTRGKAIPNQVWLVPHIRGALRWFVSTKIPLFDAVERVIGIAGVMYPIEVPEAEHAFFGKLSGVIKHMENHFAEALSMKDMAAVAGLSPAHFNRLFKAVLKMTPTEYLLSLRIHEAQRLLTQSSANIAEVAMKAGLFDQSHFTKKFRSATGVTPREFLQRFRSR
jgi:AraC-like DNA-binding protein